MLFLRTPDMYLLRLSRTLENVVVKCEVYRIHHVASVRFPKRHTGFNPSLSLCKQREKHLELWKTKPFLLETPNCDQKEVWILFP